MLADVIPITSNLRIFGEYKQAFIDYVEENARLGCDPISTGLDSVDRQLDGGLPRGGITTLTGAPGSGKSSLALWIGLNHADKVGYSGGVYQPVIFWSLEMPQKMAIARAISIISNVSWKAVLSDGDRSAINDAFDKFATVPIAVYDRSQMPGIDSLHQTLEQMRIATNSFKQFHRAPLIIIDYIQLLSDNSEDQKAGVADVSRRLTELCNGYGCTMIAVARTQRDNYQNADKDGYPVASKVLSSSAETSQIEYDSLCVMGIVNTYAEGKKTPYKWLSIAKNRLGGGEGSLPLRYFGHSGRFKAVTYRDFKAGIDAAKIKEII